MAAGREFIVRVNQALEANESFIVETTLAGKSFLKTIERAKNQGYLIGLQMVFVDSPDKSVSRVATRVRQGGHHVPTHDVIRRFPRTLQNFWFRYRILADEWLLTYNTDDSRRDVARRTDGKFEVLDEELLQLFFKLGDIEDDR